MDLANAALQPLGLRVVEEDRRQVAYAGVSYFVVIGKLEAWHGTWLLQMSGRAVAAEKMQPIASWVTTCFTTGCDPVARLYTTSNALR